MTKIQIAPSLLSADFSRLGDELRDVEAGGADLVHLDVMDGHFVPNLTIGPAVVKSCRAQTALTFDCHLMISEPQRYIDAFLKAGANMISIHQEAEPHLQRALQMIRDGGAKAGIAINPATPAESLSTAIEFCDFVLVMTVNPGFGGQAYISTMEPKIAEARALIDSSGYDIELEVDGGIGPATVAGAAGAGADVLVAGSALFRDPEGLEHAVSDLRARAEAARAA